MKITNKRTGALWSFFEYAMYLFIVIFPFLLYKSYLYSGTSTRFVDTVAIASILGIVLSFFLLKKDSSVSISKSPIFLSLGIYFVLLVASAINGLNFGISFWSLGTRTSGIWYLMNLGIFIYFLWMVFGDLKRRNKLILMLILSTSVFSFLSFLSGEGIGLIFKTYKTDAFTFGNSTFAAMYILAVFLLSLYYLFQSEKKKWWMYVQPIVLIINPNFVNFEVWFGKFSNGFIGEARASSYLLFFSLIFIFVIWLVSKIKDIKVKTKVAYSLYGVGVLVMIMCSSSLLTSNGYLRKIYLDKATAARPIMWEMSEKAIAERPILGWGTDNFDRVFEKNYDSRLLEERYGNEAWFDRAHNIFIDQLVENGFVGLISYILIYLVVVASMIYVALNSSNKSDRTLASILIVYFPIHFIELQTAFDTTISYIIVAIMLALAVTIYDRTREQITKQENEWNSDSWIKYIVLIISIIFIISQIVFGLLPYVRAQVTNGYIRSVGSAPERIKNYPILFNSPVDPYAFIWRMSTDFQIGISKNPKILEDKTKSKQLKEEVVYFENAYKNYINKNPDNFRARLNLADMLIYQRIFGVNKLDEAQKVLDTAIKIVPQAPQPYWMKAVAYIYMKKFDEARQSAMKAIDLNPEALQSQDVVKYVEKSIKNFPEIDLYFFKQI